MDDNNSNNNDDDDDDDELHIGCNFEGNGTVLMIGDQEITVKNKEPHKRKDIIHKANTSKQKYELQNQPRLGKFVNQQWNNPVIS